MTNKNLVKNIDSIELDYSDYKSVLGKEKQSKEIKITTPKDIAEQLKYIENKEQEHFVVIGLSSANTILFNEIITIGLVNSSQVHPREVFKKVIINNCVSFIVAHNHPSGNLTPSAQDIKVTQNLKECSKILGIDLLDHIIVSSKGWISLKAENLMEG